MALNDIDGAVESFKKASDLEPNDGQWHSIVICLAGSSKLNKLHIF